MDEVMKNFPENIVAGLKRLPLPEQKKILKEMGLDGNCTSGDEAPDDETIDRLEEAIRYKEAKVQLIRYMLEGMLMDDGCDILDVREKAMEFMDKYEIEAVLDEYKKLSGR